VLAIRTTTEAEAAAASAAEFSPAFSTLSPRFSREPTLNATEKMHTIDWRCLQWRPQSSTAAEAKAKAKAIAIAGADAESESESEPESEAI